MVVFYQLNAQLDLRTEQAQTALTKATRAGNPSTLRAVASKMSPTTVRARQSLDVGASQRERVSLLCDWTSTIGLNLMVFGDLFAVLQVGNAGPTSFFVGHGLSFTAFSNNFCPAVPPLLYFQVNRQLTSVDLYGETAVLLSIRSGSVSVFRWVMGCLTEEQVRQIFCRQRQAPAVAPSRTSIERVGMANGCQYIPESCP